MDRQSATEIQRDIVILGGGIAGLWLLNRLCKAGFDAVLLENERLGSGQTIASQGMIHGGIKYTLAGALTDASKALSDMPSRWGACLTGRGELDLSATRVLSSDYYMWPRQSFRSRLNAFLGSKALHGRVDSLPAEDFPAFFRGHIPGPLYKLNDIVLDVPSLLAALSRPHRERIHHIDWERAHLHGGPQGIDCLEIEDGRRLRLHAQRFLFTAGAGVEALQQRFGLELPAMQKRPLHMVMVRHSIMDPIYVHCVADQLSSTPELTVTTHACRSGGQVWYLGGELAESGAQVPAAEQIARARAKLRELFPWCNLEQADWASFRIDRAEPRQAGGQRPDKAYVKALHNCLVCWPTKLTLTPSLGDEVLEALALQQLRPRPEQDHGHLNLPFPGIADTPWDRHFATERQT